MKKIKHVIGIAAGKGGVGKSTIAVHVTLALKRLGYEVGILDADVYGPSLHQMMPFDKEVKRESGWLIPAEKDGLKLMSVAYFQKSAAIVRAPIANETIGRFLDQTAWGALDYLIVDFPPGTGDVQLTLLQKGQFSGAILVTTPQEVALIDVRKAAACFEKFYVPIMGVVENMSFYRSHGEKVFPLGEGGGERLSRELKAPCLAKIPLDPLLALNADQGRSIFDGGQTSETCDVFYSLAKKLEGVLSPDEIVTRLFQPEPDKLVIEWTDGGLSRYDLAQLEKQCPCIRCAGLKKKLQSRLSAERITHVGYYGIKIEFSQGCKAGIYSFAYLRAIARKEC